MLDKDSNCNGGFAQSNGRLSNSGAGGEVILGVNGNKSVSVSA